MACSHMFHWCDLSYNRDHIILLVYLFGLWILLLLLLLYTLSTSDFAQDTTEVFLLTLV